MTLPQSDIDAMEVLEKAATEGPWYSDGGVIWVEVAEERNGEWEQAQEQIAASNEINAAFIAASRQFIPRAISELRRLQADNAALREALKALVDKLDLFAPAINGAFQFQQIHGGKYTGPTYQFELSAARAAIGERE